MLLLVDNINSKFVYFIFLLLPRDRKPKSDRVCDIFVSLSLKSLTHFVNYVIFLVLRAILKYGTTQHSPTSYNAYSGRDYWPLFFKLTVTIFIFFLTRWSQQYSGDIANARMASRLNQQRFSYYGAHLHPTFFAFPPRLTTSVGKSSLLSPIHFLSKRPSLQETPSQVSCRANEDKKYTTVLELIFSPMFLG